MAGVVLETLSNRKLFVFGAVLLLIQIGFFLIGGLVGESVYILASRTMNECEGPREKCELRKCEWVFAS